MSLSNAYGRPRPTGGLELRSWLFMRLSGLVLLFLALGHLVIMHLLNNVDSIDYAYVVARFQGWNWRMYDLAMLVLAMIHGVNGARYVIDDYVHHPGWRRLALVTLLLVCGGLLVLGIYVAIFFHAATPSV